MRVLIIGAVVFGFAAVAPVARADDKSEIKGLFSKLSTAFKNKDSNGIFALCTPDFTEKNHGMVIDAKASRAQMEQMFAMAKSVKECSFTPSKIDVKGGNATAMSVGKSSFVIVDNQGMFGAKGLTHKMTDTSTAKCTMVKEKGKWKFKQLEMLTESPVVDGKPMQMGGPPPPPKK
jgi:ketosteroid isomerase-like protein